MCMAHGGLAIDFAVLDEGKLMAIGKPEELENHENETVRKLVAEE